jgi:glycerophosphoryl diester phosphodiesterase
MEFSGEASLAALDRLGTTSSMLQKRLPPLLAAIVAAGVIAAPVAAAEESNPRERREGQRSSTGGEKLERSPNVQVGPRPNYLVEALADGPLKQTLEGCAEMDFGPTRFSIGHRGAPLQFPEHTEESYRAAARMGAGIIECDVTFTRDTELVCRHAQCDLHLTTNILATDLARTCVEPFTPARFDPDTGARTRAASARCCASDVTLAQFESLCGKMDGGNLDASTVYEYMAGTPEFRTDLYSSCGTLLSHDESIALIKELGAGFTPELKAPEVEMPFDSDGDGEGDYSRQQYAQQLIDAYKAAGVEPSEVWPQSFDLADVRYWLEREPSFGEQAILLDGRMNRDPDFEPSPADFEGLAAAGVNIVAAPLFALVELDTSGAIVPSRYAKLARAAGLDIIAWSFERSGRLIEDVKGGGATRVKPTGATNTFYYGTTLDAIEGDGQLMETLHVLASQVGVIGVFSDWPGTVTYYASCMGLD